MMKRKFAQPVSPEASGARPAPNPKSPGFSQAELLVTLALLSIGFLSAAGTFKGIAKGIFISKTKSLASNLTQEKIELLKDKSYFRLRVTTAPAAVPGLSPAVYTDSGNYPGETLLVGGISFHRHTLVEKVRKAAGSDNLEVVPWDHPDTGLKRITVAVAWREEGEWKQQRLVNLRENPARAAANVEFQGVVRSTWGAALPGAVVEVAENPAWRDAADAAGYYEFSLSPGTYTLRASAPGYFTSAAANRNVSVSSTPVSTSFNLTQKNSGTVSGAVWINDHLVISRVVGSTEAAAVHPGFYQEYVEVFNPTTWTWTVAGAIGLKYQRRQGGGFGEDPSPIAIDIDYYTTNISSGGFYLFANTGTVRVGGVSINADAVWDTTPGGANDVNFEYFDMGPTPPRPNIIAVTDDGPTQGMGALNLYETGGGRTLDSVGWKGGGTGLPPGFFEQAPYDQTIGLQKNEQFFRRSSTQAAIDLVSGPAYDSGNNNLDWGEDNPMLFPPRNSAVQQAVVSGTPGTGSYVFADDGYSNTIHASTAGTGTRPHGRFVLGSIATGTWTFAVSSGTYFYESPVTIVSGTQDQRTVFLTSTTQSGYVSGRVTQPGGSPIAGIFISPGNAFTDAGGFYRLALAPGFTVVTANPPPGNSNYISRSATVTVETGHIVSGVNFELFGGGRIRGRVTSDGANPLPGVPVSIKPPAGAEVANVLSQTDGFFEASVPTGTYVAEPTGEYGEVVTPFQSPSVSVTGGATPVFTSTFTVGPAHGAIEGGVMLSDGSPITTGVLIVASPSPVPDPPPAMTNALRTGAQPYYMTSSNSVGRYRLNVRLGSYYVYGFYSTFQGGTAVVTRRSLSGVSVAAGQTTYGQDMAW
jgi:hypothetical protein